MLATLRGAYSFVRSYDNHFTILLASRGRLSWLICELCDFAKLLTCKVIRTVYVIMVLTAYANSKFPGAAALLRRLARAFTVCTRVIQN